MNTKSNKIMIVGIFTLFLIALTAIYFILNNNDDGDVRLLGSNRAACSNEEMKTFRNTYVEFEYPCNWHFVSEDITDSNTFDIRDDNGRYIGFIMMREEEHSDDSSKFEDFTKCESGEYFSEKKLQLRTSDGTLLDACHHSEHGGETLLIHMENEKYLNITSLDGGIFNVITPTLIIR